MTLQANGFDWDRGNRAKCEKHGLSIAAIESLFARPLAILPDAAHSQQEERLRAIGRTEKGRGVFIIFTLRRKGDELLIRPISARYMHKKEIEAYEKENPDL
ncbi:MAG: BrnT family toxin [Acidobacteriales bacterium]|nr:BrnT family toxin [Terriglobales bacterium]